LAFIHRAFLDTKAHTCPRVKTDHSGAQEEFWPDVLPDVTND